MENEMKNKKKVTKKLSLNKRTITNLNGNQMSRLKGGEETNPSCLICLSIIESNCPTDCCSADCTGDLTCTYYCSEPTMISECIYCENTQILYCS